LLDQIGDQVERVGVEIVTHGFEIRTGLGQLALVTVVTLLLGEWLVPFFTSEYSPEKQAQTLQFFRCLAPFSIFWGMSLLMTLLLQANKKFVLGALAPVIVPAFAVASLILGYDTMGIYALLWGTVIGAGLQLSLLCSGYFRRYCTISIFTGGKLWSPEMREVLRTATPYLLSGLIMGSAILVDMGMAAWLDSGSVSVLAYGHRVCAIALTLVSTAVAEAFFPYMSDLVAGNEWKRLRKTVMQFSGLILVGSIPVIAAIWWSSEWLVGLLFERGEFTHDDTLRVAGVVRWLCLQIPFYILAVLGSRVVCAMLASRFILLTTVVNLAVNIGCNILFLRIMGINGIALSTSLVYFFSSVMLYAFLLLQVKKRIEGSENPSAT